METLNHNINNTLGKANKMIQGTSGLLDSSNTSSAFTVDSNKLNKIQGTNVFNSGIMSREELLMRGLLKFFSQTFNLDQLLPILDGTSELSLRVLDWFVTNYSKQYDVVFNIKKGEQIRQFVVHNHYKAQLKGYSKKQFDPFCRGKRVFLEFGKNQEIETTVGQLNFFKWAIENKVLDFVHNNLKSIIEDMNLRGSKAKDKKIPKKNAKKELSISATKSVTKHNVLVTVKFD